MGRTRWRKRRGMLSSKVTRADWVEKKGNKTFVDVVKGHARGEGKGQDSKILQQSLPWMKKSVVGQYVDGLDFDKLSEEFVKWGMNMIRVRPSPPNTKRMGEYEGVDKAKQSLVR